jgi:hypothetical protein
VNPNLVQCDEGGTKAFGGTYSVVGVKLSEQEAREKRQLAEGAGEGLVQ